jgi:hypothetical protein
MDHFINYFINGFSAVSTEIPFVFEKEEILAKLYIIGVAWIKRHGFFFEKHSTNVDTHICTSTHPYEYTHAHHIPMSTSKRLSRLDLKIHEVGHQERITVDRDNTHVKSEI